MGISRTLMGLGMAVSLAALADSASAGQDGGTVVAEVNSHKVTLAELEQKQASKLLQARYKYYLAERDALEELIDDELLEMQASREHLSVEELLKRYVISQVKDPTEDQLKVYYEGVNTEQPYEEVRDKVLGTLRQFRMTRARTAYLKSLREQAGIVIALGPPKAEIARDNAPMRGPQNAPVQLVEFADYECPYCQKIHPELNKLQNEFSGQLALVFKDYPLSMHRHAQKVAEAARCADAQGKFWEFHDALFENRKFEVADLKEQARTFKLDAARFDKCLDSGEQAAVVHNDAEQGRRLGLTGTPSFFINGHFISGAVKYRALREMIEQQLNTKTETGAAPVTAHAGSQGKTGSDDFDDGKASSQASPLR